MNYEKGTKAFVKRGWATADDRVTDSGEEVLEVEIVASSFNVKDLKTGDIYESVSAEGFFPTREAAQKSPTLTNPDYK